MEKEVIIRETFGVDLAGLLVKEFLEGVDIYAVFCGDEDAVVVHLRHPGLLELFKGYILAGLGRQVIFIFRSITEGIYLIENQNPRFLVGSADISQRLVDYRYLLLESGMGDIDDMNQEVCFTDLIES